MLRDNATIGVRAGISIFLVSVPWIVYGKYEKKWEYEVEDEVVRRDGGKFLRYQQTGDDRYMYE